MPWTSRTFTIPTFKTGTIFVKTSVEAYGLESFVVSRLCVFFKQRCSVTTTLAEVEEEQQGLREKNEKKLDGMERSKSKSDAHYMHG